MLQALDAQLIGPPAFRHNDKERFLTVAAGAIFLPLVGVVDDLRMDRACLVPSGV